jgi:hypothetical protein
MGKKIRKKISSGSTGFSFSPHLFLKKKTLALPFPSYNSPFLHSYNGTFNDRVEDISGE